MRPDKENQNKKNDIPTSVLELEKERFHKFKEMSVLFDKIVQKSYLPKLSEYELMRFDSSGRENIAWYKITKIVYEKGIFFPDKMAMLYSSLHKVCKTVTMALHKESNGKIDLYIGVKDENGGVDVSGPLFQNSIKGLLSGIKIQRLTDASMLLKEFEVSGTNAKNTSISCVSGIASLPDDKKERFIQGIENLINSAKKMPSFTVLFVASKISDLEASQIQQSYENLYTEISPLAQLQISYNDSYSENISRTLTEGFNHSVSENISRTISHGTSKSISESETTTESSGWNYGASLVLSGGKTVGKSTTAGVTDTIGSNEQTADNKGTTTQDGTHHDKSEGLSHTQTEGITSQITQQNRHVKSCMDVIDKQISRIQKSKALGLWSAATYFIANENTTVLSLAGIYKGIIMGDKSDIEAVSVNHWPKSSDKISMMLDYLRYQNHPLFNLGNNVFVTPGSLVDSRELAIHMSLPQSSVPGLLVREEKTFGRDVKTQIELTDENAIPIGQIVHLDELDESEIVRLGLNGLSKHTLVTGTTGSGKSNTLYLLLDELSKRNKKFLVIEPAKGEYKEVFGNKFDVDVYGTNPRVSKLLTLNPFIFSNDIDVYEHIDSLVEIFNACWPMYAAMPQVMKHSIMEAYRACGWNLEKSENPKGIYPNFQDVLWALKDYINSSEYSSDTKGDYKGSLETRLQSLCEGVVGRIFSGTPISDEELFNKNVILDLSRIKSSETKSLLMGLLVLKLNEFRMSEHKGMNLDLRHVTVLEEAHNLLKRTSTAQTAESSNVTGMAVEKIANSMAEMRTYGEGFIIADQSPSMLDMATIRNTNTKIIMALPEKDDREIVGKSVGLEEAQIVEISRLRTGEAIVYQNGWEEAVKSRIKKFQIEEDGYNEYESNIYKEISELNEELQDSVMKSLYRDLCELSTFSENEIAFEKELFIEKLLGTNLSGRIKCEVVEKINSVEILSVDDCASIIARIIGLDICLQMQGAKDFPRMYSWLYEQMKEQRGLKDNEDIDIIVNLYMKGCSMEAEKPFYDEWLENSIKFRMI